MNIIIKLFLIIYCYTHRLVITQSSPENPFLAGDSNYTITNKQTLSGQCAESEIFKYLALNSAALSHTSS